MVCNDTLAQNGTVKDAVELVPGIIRLVAIWLPLLYSVKNPCDTFDFFMCANADEDAVDKWSTLIGFVAGAIAFSTFTFNVVIWRFGVLFGTPAEEWLEKKKGNEGWHPNEIIAIVMLFVLWYASDLAHWVTKKMIIMLFYFNVLNKEQIKKEIEMEEGADEKKSEKEGGEEEGGEEVLPWDQKIALETAEGVKMLFDKARRGKNGIWLALAVQVWYVGYGPHNAANSAVEKVLEGASLYLGIVNLIYDLVLDTFADALKWRPRAEILKKQREVQAGRSDEMVLPNESRLCWCICCRRYCCGINLT